MALSKENRILVSYLCGHHDFVEAPGPYDPAAVLLGQATVGEDGTPRVNFSGVCSLCVGKSPYRVEVE